MEASSDTNTNFVDQPKSEFLLDYHLTIQGVMAEKSTTMLQCPKSNLLFNYQRHVNRRLFMNVFSRLYKIKELILVTGWTKMAINKFTGPARIMEITFVHAILPQMDA